MPEKEKISYESKTQDIMQAESKSRGFFARLVIWIKHEINAYLQKSSEERVEDKKRDALINDAYKNELLKENILAARLKARLEVRERMKPKQQGFNALGGGLGLGVGSSKPAFCVGIGGGLSGGSSRKRKNLLRV